MEQETLYQYASFQRDVVPAMAGERKRRHTGNIYGSNCGIVDTSEQTQEASSGEQARASSSTIKQSAAPEVILDDAGPLPVTLSPGVRTYRYV